MATAQTSPPPADVAAPTSAAASPVTNGQAMAQAETEAGGTFMKKYITPIAIAIVVAIILYALWYAYDNFIVNQSKSDTVAKTSDTEKDEPAAGFDLRSAVAELQDMQKRILANISEVSDV